MNELQKQAMVEHLVMQNAVEFSGIDEDTGEMLYSITDKLKTVNPELFSQLKTQYEDHMFKMIKRGPKTMTWRIR
jgi:hypothetical protein